MTPSSIRPHKRTHLSLSSSSVNRSSISISEMRGKEESILTSGRSSIGMKMMKKGKMASMRSLEINSPLNNLKYL